MTQKSFQQADVLAVLYKAAESKYSHSLLHTDLNEVSSQDLQDWREELLHVQHVYEFVTVL